MEATGVYWKPIWHILEGHFSLMLGNAAEIKNVPGRKTDVNDAKWIADLLAHGLIRSSFVPPQPIQELRDLTRTRKQLVREQAQHVQRIQKVLEPFRSAVEHLVTIPGVSRTTAAVVVAEIGVDMSAFPTAAHLVSWAGLSPRQDESAGNRRSTHTRPQGWLKTTLVQAVWAAIKQKDSYLSAQFLRLKARRGAKKAIVVVAASMLTAVYYMLRNDVGYHDLGADYFQQRSREKAVFQLVQRLQRLGYAVQLHTAA